MGRNAKLEGGETMGIKEVVKELTRPFSVEEIELKVQATNRDRTRGLVVPYVDARAVLDRLDEVIGPDGWHDSYEVLADKANGDTRLVEVKCRLTILGVTKEDVGEGDSLKAAFSDALKRAAVKFGIGRHLYRSKKVWADLDKNGQILNYDEVKATVLSTDTEERVPPPPSRDVEALKAKALRDIVTTMAKYGLTKEQVRQLAIEYVGRELESASDMTVEEATEFATFLAEYAEAERKF